MLATPPYAITLLIRQDATLMIHYLQPLATTPTLIRHTPITLPFSLALLPLLIIIAIIFAMPLLPIIARLRI